MKCQGKKISFSGKEQNEGRLPSTSCTELKEDIWHVQAMNLQKTARPLYLSVEDLFHASLHLKAKIMEILQILTSTFPWKSVWLHPASETGTVTKFSG